MATVRPEKTSRTYKLRSRSIKKASTPLGAIKEKSLFSFYREGVLVPDRVADALRLTKTQLAETVGVRREALSKWERIKAHKTQTRVREMVEIVDRVKEWAGGREQALAWYRSQPIPAFGGRTAEALVKDGKAGALRDYLDHLAMGGFARGFREFATGLMILSGHFPPSLAQVQPFGAKGSIRKALKPYTWL
jgi:transcriptional regulator with XRE-family HTH domain